MVVRAIVNLELFDLTPPLYDVVVVSGKMPMMMCMSVVDNSGCALLLCVTSPRTSMVEPRVFISYLVRSCTNLVRYTFRTIFSAKSRVSYDAIE